MRRMAFAGKFFISLIFSADFTIMTVFFHTFSKVFIYSQLLCASFFSNYIILLIYPKGKDADKKEKAEEGAAKRTPFLPPQMGYLSRLRKFGELGQYLLDSLPYLFLPLGYILQVGIVNPPGFMHLAGQLV